MREIKFDIILWDGSDPTTIRHYNLEEALKEDLIDFQDGGMVSPDESVIIREYTGLKDQNDKEIYEGDILDCNYGEYFDPHGSHYLTNRRYRFIMRSEDGTINGFPEFNCEVEIIGNIYENPKLLEDKNERD